MTGSGWGQVGGKGISKKRQRTHGHEQQCGDFWWGVGMKGLKCNVKKSTLKIFLKKQKNT